jgi:serine/threonine protein kinase
MTLARGTRLGSYEIRTLLGAGGMGEVYCAHDTKLGRNIALKVLPATFAHDPDRVARFEREARTLAALNHPHIAQLHGFEQLGDTSALVMELVDGQDLAQRIAEGPIALDEALPIARQITDALQAAHDHSIVHRDLKPANIKLRPDGTVKILDFGLAKALDPGEGTTPASAVAESATLTSPAMTMRGMILGTAAYMSPEQVRGGVIDRRADIWAFGCVLFEMLTGQRPFEGATVSDTLAQVLRKDVDWTLLPDTTPTAIRSLLGHCLARDARRRLRDIGDARLALEEQIVYPASRETATATRHVSPSRRLLPFGATAIAAAGLTLLAVWLRPSMSATPVHPLHVSVMLGDGLTMAPSVLGGFDLSPDGTTLAFVGAKANAAPQLYVRRLDQLQSRPLPGTEYAMRPFFSPDGRQLAFFTRSNLNVVPVFGGATTAIAIAVDPRGGAWARDARSILFTPNSTRGTTLMRVPTAGGSAAPAPGTLGTCARDWMSWIAAIVFASQYG